jgi:signal transduction histidine kinase
MAERSRPAPAALILGVLTGVLAMLLVMPAAIPLTLRLSTAEHALATREVHRAATVAAGLIIEDGALPPGTGASLQMAHLEVISPEGLVVHEEGVPLPPEVRLAACGRSDLHQIIGAEDGTTWATSCMNANGFRVIAAFRPTFSASGEVALVVITVAVVVGIVSALGVLRLLAPLSRISKALDQVGAGERGIRLEGSTGMPELDELIARLNGAAQAMEDREDEILSRMKVVQEMARMVAHEVRNPLQSLELLTSLIVSEEEESEREEIARSIHQEIRALDMVVTRLLKEGTAAGGLRLQTRNASVAPLVKQVVTLRTPEAKKQGIALEVGEVVDLEIEMDPALLGRSIENLVLNAMQAVPPRRGLVRISVVRDGADLAMVVEDNGHGVPESFGDEIYAPNVSGRTGGTGLGLALVKGVIEAHGGTIRHDRSPLGGARFTARIPLSEVAIAP